MMSFFIQQQTQDQGQAILSNKTPLQLLWFKTVITTTAVITVAFLWWWTTEARRVRKIVRRDGSQTLPTPAPVLPRWIGFLGGHTLRIDIKKMITQMEKWADEFGGDYVLHAFGRHIVVVTSAADIRRILTLRPAKFARGVDHEQSLWAATEAGLAPSLFFDEGKQWGRSRRLISPNLVGKNITAMIPFVSKIGERLCDKLGKRADLDDVVEVRGYFARFTHDIIALAAFGVDVDSTSATDDRPCRSFQAIESSLSTLNGLLFDATKIFQWKYLSNVVPWIRCVKEDARHLDDIVKRTIDAARNSVDGDASTSENEEDFAGTLLRKIISRSHADTKNDRMKFSDDEVVNQVNTLFVAGTDTTALAISWAMFYLVKNPMAFARCRAEGLSAAPSSGGMVSTPEQLSQLAFCAAVFQEVVRLRGAGPGLPHTSLEEHTLTSGYKIKKGGAVMVLSRFASIAEDNFSRGADFVPERWIESERVGALLGKGVEDREQGEIRHNEDAFFGFGGGPRVCPGKDMAKVEATMIIAAICSRFDVSLAPCQSDPPEEELQFTVGPAAVHLIFKRKVDGDQD